MTLRTAPLALVLLVLLVLLIAGCGGDDSEETDQPQGGSGDSGAVAGETFEADEFDLTFQYPEDLQEREEIEFSRSAGSAAAATAGVGIDEANLIAVQRFDLQTEVTPENLGEVKREADALFSQLAGERAGGRRTTVAGLPALEYEIDLEDPPDAQTRAVAIFDGNTQYLLNCQSTPEQRQVIENACDLALRTLEVE